MAEQVAWEAIETSYTKTVDSQIKTEIRPRNQILPNKTISDWKIILIVPAIN